MLFKQTLVTFVLLTLVQPVAVLGQGAGPGRSATVALFEQGKPFAQDLVITAYYSPLPDQCCYVRGSFAADTELNGQGIRGADGTAVYAGMAAAPGSYPFGTRVELPGVGVVTVHDRGGAIREWENAHRIDVWVGSGEEGLARALAFGVQRVRGTVYPQGSGAPAESIDLSALPSPPEKLKPYIAADASLLDLRAEAGDRTASVQFLQEHLKTLGYFADAPTGFFGPVTRESLRAFLRDMGSDEPDDRLTERGTALLEAAYRRRDAVDPVPQVVSAGSSPSRIAQAQRTLRFLDFYDGRTNGDYDQTTKDAVLAFQKAKGIVTTASQAGAGRIGPQTRRAIVLAWRAKHASRVADHLLALRKLDTLLAEKGYDLRQFLGKGDRGENVRALQRFLASKGYLPASDVTGAFGDRTEQALIAYQKSAKVINDAGDTGAGFAGPATLAAYRRDVRTQFLRIVRAEGWDAI